MAVAADVFSTGTSGTGNLSWTHTPTGTPRAVIVVIRQGGADGANTDEVSGVTYGGVAMTEVSAHSPILHSSGTAEADGTLYTYFLGSSIPTGAQTVAVTVTGSNAKEGNSITLTADADTEIVDAASIDQQLPSGNVVTVGTLSLSGRTSYVMLHCLVGSGSLGASAPSAGWTSADTHDFGVSVTGKTFTYDTIGSSDVTADYTETVGGINSAAALAVSEVVTGGHPARARLGSLLFRPSPQITHGWRP